MPAASPTAAVTDREPSDERARLLGPPSPPAGRPDGYSERCPCRPLLDRLGDRWSSEVIAALFERPHRFGQLRRRLEPVSHKVLTQSLRALERDGLVDRAVADDTLRTVTYSLTGIGEQIAGPLTVLRDWSHANSGDIAAAQRRYDMTDAPASVAQLRLLDHRHEPIPSDAVSSSRT